jgi:tetratricopeptide (TPR) repeat protein
LASYQKNDLEDAYAKFTDVQAKVPQYEEVGRYLQLTKKSLAEVLFNQAQVNSENGQLNDATKKLERAATLAPEDQRIKTALAVAQRDLSSKNAEDAKKLYKDGLEAYLNGQTEKASGLWKKALDLDPSNEEALKALTKVEEQKKYGTTNPEK